MDFEFRAKLWMWDGPSAWYFITLPQDISDEIKAMFGNDRPGWGSIRVEVKTGKSKWKTSIFPDKKSGGYLLPVKALVRRENKLSTGDSVALKLAISES